MRKHSEQLVLEAMMEHWEHLVLTLEADAKKEADFLRSTWPAQSFPKYAPESLIPQLDVLGRQGWELVAAQPVIVGDDGDVYAPVFANGQWTHTYLCFFKRNIGAQER